LTSSVFDGAVTIASEGLLNVNGATLNAQVTVESGGELLLTCAGSFLGQVASDTNNWL